MTSNSIFFTKSDKGKSNRPPFIFRASSKSAFSTAGAPGNTEPEEDWYNDDICPNCNEPLSEHSDRERLRCAYDRIGFHHNVFPK